MNFLCCVCVKFRDASRCEESSCLRMLLDKGDACLGPWTPGRCLSFKSLNSCLILEENIRWTLIFPENFHSAESNTTISFSCLRTFYVELVS